MTISPGPERALQLRLPVVYDHEDYTVYLNHDQPYFDACKQRPGDQPVKLGVLHEKEIATIKPTESWFAGRALICSCFQSRRLSVTVRKEGQNGTLHSYPDWRFAKPPSGYQPKTDRDEVQRCVSIDSVCRLLAKLIFTDGATPDQGLIVVSGSTASAKSQVARGLIHYYLFEEPWRRKSRAGDRRPHLVTYEDPIEKLLFDPFAGTGPNNDGSAVDYTPRQKGDDVSELRVALLDAKRQHPFVYFVSETRDADDWGPLLEFAGSGHLVITTTHANSLAETFDLMFRAAKAETAARRGFIASRLRAVINQKAIPPSASHAAALVPSVWRHTGAAVNEMTSDGLSSLIPHNPRVERVAARGAGAAPEIDDMPDEATLGRAWFTHCLVDFEAYLDKDNAAGRKCDYLREAVRLDLRGE